MQPSAAPVLKPGSVILKQAAPATTAAVPPPGSASAARAGLVSPGAPAGRTTSTGAAAPPRIMQVPPTTMTTATVGARPPVVVRAGGTLATTPATTAQLAGSMSGAYSAKSAPVIQRTGSRPQPSASVTLPQAQQVAQPQSEQVLASVSSPNKMPASARSDEVSLAGEMDLKSTPQSSRAYVDAGAIATPQPEEKDDTTRALVLEQSQRLQELQQLLAQLCDELANVGRIQAEQSERILAQEEARGHLLEVLRGEMEERWAAESGQRPAAPGGGDEVESLRQCVSTLEQQQAKQLEAIRALELDAEARGASLEDFREELRQLRADVGPPVSPEAASPANLRGQVSELRLRLLASASRAAECTEDSEAEGGDAREGQPGGTALEELRVELLRLAGLFEELRPDELRMEVDDLKQEMLSIPRMPDENVAALRVAVDGMKDELLGLARAPALGLEELGALRKEVDELRADRLGMQAAPLEEVPLLLGRQERLEGEVKRLAAVVSEVDAQSLRVGISELQTEMARVLDVELAGLWAGQEALRAEIEARAGGSSDVRVQLLELRDSNARISGQQHALEDALRAQIEALAHNVGALKEQSAATVPSRDGGSGSSGLWAPTWRVDELAAALDEVRRQQRALQDLHVGGSGGAGSPAVAAVAALQDKEAQVYLSRLEDGMEAESHHRARAVAELHQRLGREVAAVFREVVLRTDDIRSKVDTIEAARAAESGRAEEGETSIARAAATCERLVAQLLQVEQAVQRERDERCAQSAEFRSEWSRAIDAERCARLEQGADLTGAVSRERSERCGECSELRSELSKLLGEWHIQMQGKTAE